MVQSYTSQEVFEENSSRLSIKPFCKSIATIKELIFSKP